jgi:hypothetical protein
MAIMTLVNGYHDQPNDHHDPHSPNDHDLWPDNHRGPLAYFSFDPSQTNTRPLTNDPDPP